MTVLFCDAVTQIGKELIRGFAVTPPDCRWRRLVVEGGPMSSPDKYARDARSWRDFAKVNHVAAKHLFGSGNPFMYLVAATLGHHALEMYLKAALISEGMTVFNPKELQGLDPGVGLTVRRAGELDFRSAEAGGGRDPGQFKPSGRSRLRLLRQSAKEPRVFSRGPPAPLLRELEWEARVMRHGQDRGAARQAGQRTCSSRSRSPSRLSWLASAPRRPPKSARAWSA